MSASLAMHDITVDIRCSLVVFYITLIALLINNIYNREVIAYYQALYCEIDAK